MTRSTLFDRIATAVIGVAILSMSVVIVRRELFAEPVTPEPLAPTYEKNWERLLTLGTVVGDKSAPVKIIEFGDLQCPGCRGFQRAVQEIRKEFGKRVSVVFLHYPLPYHPFALPAARAAECAGRVGVFGSFLDVVYAKQDSLRFKPMWSYAREAGVLDSSTFAHCVSDTSSTNLVFRTTIAAGDSIKLTATPTVLVNGWRWEAVPPRKYLATFIAELLKGEHAAP